MEPTLDFTESEQRLLQIWACCRFEFALPLFLFDSRVQINPDPIRKSLKFSNAELSSADNLLAAVKSLEAKKIINASALDQPGCTTISLVSELQSFERRHQLEKKVLISDDLHDGKLDDLLCDMLNCMACSYPHITTARFTRSLVGMAHPHARRFGRLLLTRRRAKNCSPALKILLNSNAYVHLLVSLQYHPEEAWENELKDSWGIPTLKSDLEDDAMELDAILKSFEPPLEKRGNHVSYALKVMQYYRDLRHGRKASVPSPTGNEIDYLFHVEQTTEGEQARYAKIFSKSTPGGEKVDPKLLLYIRLFIDMHWFHKFIPEKHPQAIPFLTAAYEELRKDEQSGDQVWPFLKVFDLAVAGAQGRKIVGDGVVSVDIGNYFRNLVSRGSLVGYDDRAIRTELLSILPSLGDQLPDILLQISSSALGRFGECSPQAVEFLIMGARVLFGSSELRARYLKTAVSKLDDAFPQRPVNKLNCLLQVSYYWPDEEDLQVYEPTLKMALDRGLCDPAGVACTYYLCFMQQLNTKTPAEVLKFISETEETVKRRLGVTKTDQAALQPAIALSKAVLAATTAQSLDDIKKAHKEACDATARFIPGDEQMQQALRFISTRAVNYLADMTIKRASAQAEQTSMLEARSSTQPAVDYAELVARCYIDYFGRSFKHTGDTHDFLLYFFLVLEKIRKMWRSELAQTLLTASYKALPRSAVVFLEDLREQYW